MSDYTDGYEAARKTAEGRVKWYRTDLAYRAPELWPSHGDLLDRIVHDMEHMPMIEPESEPRNGSLKDRLSAALDSCSSCCLDDKDDRCRVLAAVLEATKQSDLDLRLQRALEEELNILDTLKQGVER